MVARGRRRYWVLAGGVLGNLAANFYVGESAGVSFSYSSADILEVLVALVFAPRVSSVSELIQPKLLMRFLLGGVLLAPVASGSIATGLLKGQLSENMFPEFANWFISDALSLAIFTPAALVFWTGEVKQLLRADRRKRTAFLLLLVCVVTTGVFGQTRFPLIYWALPPIVLLAFQADFAGMLVGLLLCLAIAVSFTMHGSGPLWMFAYESMQGRILGLQLFLVAALGIALPISATQTQRNRMIALLRDGERRYRILAEHSSDVVLSLSLDGTISYVSSRIEVTLGRAPDELVGTPFMHLAFHADGQAIATAIEAAKGDLSEQMLIARLRRTDGQPAWTELHLRAVVDAFSGKPEALTATVRDITERKETERRFAMERDELHGLAFKDSLTGLSNRRYLDQQLELLWQQEVDAAGERFLAVLMVDVDHYKSYNDSYGHQAGDECLRVIASAISSAAGRSSDVVGRYGGEEFTLILRNADAAGARVVAERIREKIEELRLPHASSPFGLVTLSIGVAAQQPTTSSKPSELVEAADRALYAAKRAGRNQIS
jgi:diguanylate cyclase (GGDEF)-like protein/PAS domain S-box-containing protein